jgi:hypothetical protein
VDGAAFRLGADHLFQRVQVKMDIKNYINPRSLGNTEPKQLFGFDIFFD